MEFVDLLCDHKRANRLLGLSGDEYEEEENDILLGHEDDEEIDFDDDDEETTTLFSASETETQTYDYTNDYDYDYDTGDGSTTLSGSVSHILPHNDNDNDDSTTFQKTTRLFDAIDNHYWSSVETFLATGKWAQGGRSKIPPIPLREEARQWSVTLNKSGKVIRRRLPIHAALENGAPLSIIQQLIELYPSGTSCADSQGNLPLHLGFLYDASHSVLEYLLEAHPQAVLVKNSGSSRNRTAGKGVYPMECTSLSATAATTTSRRKDKKRKAMIQQCQERARQLSLQTLDGGFQEASKNNSHEDEAIITVDSTTSIKESPDIVKSNSKASNDTTTSKVQKPFSKRKLLLGKIIKDNSKVAPNKDKNVSPGNQEEDLMEIKKELEQLRREQSQGSASRTKNAAVDKQINNKSIDRNNNNDSNKTNKDGDDVYTMTPNGWVWTTFFSDIGATSQSQSQSASSNSTVADVDCHNQQKQDRLPAIAEVMSNEPEDSNNNNNNADSTDNNHKDSPIKSVASFSGRLKQSLSNKLAGVAGRTSEQHEALYENDDDGTMGESVEVNLNDPSGNNATTTKPSKKKFPLVKFFRKSSNGNTSRKNHNKGEANAHTYLDNVTVSSSSFPTEQASLLSRFSIVGAVTGDNTNNIVNDDNGVPAAAAACVGTSTAPANKTKSFKQRFFPKQASQWWHQQRGGVGGDTTTARPNQSGPNDTADSESIVFTPQDVKEEGLKSNDVGVDTTAGVNGIAATGGVFSNAWNYESNSFAQAMSGMLHTKSIPSELAETGKPTDLPQEEQETSGNTAWRKRRLSSFRKSSTDGKKEMDSAPLMDESKVLKGSNHHSFLENAFLLASGRNTGAIETTPSANKEDQTLEEEVPKTSSALDRVFKKGRGSQNKKSSQKAAKHNLGSQHPTDTKDDDEHTESEQYEDEDDESFDHGAGDQEDEEEDDDSESTSSDVDNSSGTNSLSSVSYASDVARNRNKETGVDSGTKDGSWICAPDGTLAAILSQASESETRIQPERQTSSDTPLNKAKSKKQIISLPRAPSPVEEGGSDKPKATSGIGGFFRRRKSRDKLMSKVTNSSTPDKAKFQHRAVEREEKPGASVSRFPAYDRTQRHTCHTRHASLSALEQRAARHSRHASLSSLEGTIAKAILPPKGDWRAEYEDYFSSNNSTGTKSSNRSSSKRSAGKAQGPIVEKKPSGLFGKIKKSRNRRKGKKYLKNEQGRQPDSDEDQERLLVSEQFTREPSGPRTEDILQDLETVSPLSSYQYRNRSSSFQKLVDSETMASPSPHRSHSSSFRKLDLPSLDKDASTQSTGPVVSESAVENSDEGNIYLVRVQFQP